MRLVIGRIGRPHGLAGEVTVEVRTDLPEVRFAPGAVLDVEPAERGPLRIAGTRDMNGRLLVHFDGVADRTAAEELRDTLIVVNSASSPALASPEEYWDHQLIGLQAVDTSGEVIGELADVLHPPGADLLAVRRPDGREVLVPFVAALVPHVDLAAGRVVVDPPAGLLDL
ncbi:MAG: ribosome maturation factor RimM [Frankiaceae bacterium]|jgi:16S rRNA processing protein RimM